jgi:signal transduction histidine kinase
MRGAITFLRTPFTTRSWAEFAYAVGGLPLGLLGFVFTICSVTFAIPGLATILGLPLVALGLLGARAFASAHRGIARHLLGWRRGWRAYAYLLVNFPVAIASFVTAVVLRVGGAIFLFAPVLQQPEDAWTYTTEAGYVHHAIQYGPFQFDTWPKLMLLVAQGMVMTLLAPWALRAVLLVNRFLQRSLLGPSPLSQRVLNLEMSRAAALEDAAARLRQIERDLHDGAQAQLVALAMKLSLATEKLAVDPGHVNVVRVRELVETANATAQSAIVNLRDLVAGIHPPILNDGLPAALATLTARSATPAELSIDLPARPSPAIEAIAYYCAAELLTNVAKHSGAQRTSVDLSTAHGGLRLRVSDDGTGGATAGKGSGLAGLAERAQTVDGTLSIASPPGGPTTITVHLPMHA